MRNQFKQINKINQTPNQINVVSHKRIASHMVGMWYRCSCMHTLKPRAHGTPLFAMLNVFRVQTGGNWIRNLSWSALDGIKMGINWRSLFFRNISILLSGFWLLITNHIRSITRLNGMQICMKYLAVILCVEHYEHLGFKFNRTFYANKLHEFWVKRGNFPKIATMRCEVRCNLWKCIKSIWIATPKILAKSCLIAWIAQISTLAQPTSAKYNVEDNNWFRYSNGKRSLLFSKST